MVPITRHHENEIVAIADESPVALAGLLALFPLPLGAHLLMPLLVEMIIQRRQCDIGEQR
jgi:hypothetical protein